MSEIESSQTRIDYKTIAHNYGYKPIPEGFYPTPVINLKIDWKNGNSERSKKQYESMLMTTENTLNISSNNEQDEIILDKVEITTDKQSLLLRTSIFPLFEKNVLWLKLIDENGDAIGEYVSRQNNNSWNMGDRITSEAYRGKGIASEMIKTTENCIQAYADCICKDQEIIVEASQLTVLSVFLQQGYEIVEEDKKRFTDTLSRLETGDSTLVLASCLKDFQQNREEHKTWYIFDKNTYELLGSTIWEYNENTRKSNYLEKSIRFKLRKSIKSKSQKIKELQKEVVQQIHSI